MHCIFSLIIQRCPLELMTKRKKKSQQFRTVNRNLLLSCRDIGRALIMEVFAAITAWFAYQAEKSSQHSSPWFLKEVMTLLSYCSGVVATIRALLQYRVCCFSFDLSWLQIQTANDHFPNRVTGSPSTKPSPNKKPPTGRIVSAKVHTSSLELLLRGPMATLGIS